MKKNCAEFEARLDDFIAGALSDAEQRRAEDHLSGCASCRRLVAIVRGEKDDELQESSPDLVARVLQETVGSACRRAQVQLPEWLEDALSPDDVSLLSLHTEHCRSCHALAAALSSLRTDLPEMACAELDADFTSEVLEKTRGLRRQRIPWSERLREWWSHLQQRPRLAWELAYVATVLLVVLCGTPASPWRSMPRHALALVQVNPTTAYGATKTGAGKLWQVVDDDLEQLWQRTGARLLDAARSAGSDHASEHQQAVDAWLDLRGRSARLKSAIGRGDLGQASLVLNEMGGDFKKLWHGLRSTPDSPESPENSR